MFPFKSSLKSLLALAVVGGAPSAVVAQPIGGSNFASTSAVAAVVKIPKPWYAPKSTVTEKMRETIGQYESLPGLSFKAYSLAQTDGQYGGLYLWKDLATASAHFGPTWFEQVEKNRGVKGQVRFFEVPVAIDNTPGGTSFNANSTVVATLVSVTTPPGITRARLIQEFQQSIPVYQKVPGLLRKHFTLTDDAKSFGGIYFWKDQASAQQWFSDTWKDRVRKTYGADASIEWFDVPVVLPSKLESNRLSIPGL